MTTQRHSLPSIRTCPTKHIPYNWQTHMDMSLAPLTCFTLQLFLGVVRTVGLQTCAMTRVYHHSVMQMTGTSLNILRAASSHPSLLHPLPTRNLCSVSAILPFREHPRARIMQEGACRPTPFPSQDSCKVTWWLLMA